MSDASLNCKGKIKVAEFNQDDDEVVMDITQEKPDEFTLIVKRIINKEMADLLLKTIKGLNKAMRDKDADENKLK